MNVKTINLKDTVQKIKSLLPVGNKVFELHEPFFDDLEERNVKKCIDDRWVSYQGSFVTELEKKLANYCEVKHAIALVNGTTALYMALKAVGVQPNDEVIIPALTFVATANAVHHLNAIAHFLDVSYNTMGIDFEKMDEYLKKITIVSPEGLLVNKNTGRIIRAIVPVHVLGHPVDLNSLIELANRYNLKIVEDAAEALGSVYQGKKVGSFGLLSCLSFNGNKIVTTGGGGAILTNDDVLAEKIRHITTTAKIAHQYDFIHDEIAYNYRLPNINAAIGCAQMEKIENFILRKRRLAKLYQENLCDSDLFKVFHEPMYCESNYWLNAIVLNSNHILLMHELLNEFIQAGIKCRPFWKPLHKLKMYTQNPRSSLEVTEDLYQRTICLPSSVFLNYA